MGDHGGDKLLVLVGGEGGVVQQGRLPVGDQAPVLHGASIEVRQRNLVWMQDRGLPRVHKGNKRQSPK